MLCVIIWRNLINFNKIALLGVFFLILLIIPCSFASDVNIASNDSDLNNINVNSINDINLVTNSSSKDLSLSLDNSIINHNSNSLSNSEANKYYVSSSVNQSGDGSKENPFKTLKEGLDAVCDNGYVYVSKGNYSLFNYELNKSINIIGENRDSVFVNGITGSPTLKIIDGNILLKGLSFANANVSDLGYECAGAITKEYGTLNLTDCAFINNQGPEAGALYNTAGDLTVNSCVFKSNVLSRTGGCDGGGAIFLLYGNILINNSFFDSNIAYNFPGAAIYQVKSNLVISNSVFVNNKADKSNGGALYFNQQGHNKVFNCTFLNNSADNGGAIYADVGKSQNPGDLTVDNSYFDLNSANSGASIYVTDIYSKVTIKNSVFKNSHAEYGGAIYLSQATLILINNTAINCSASEGNYIQNYGKINNVYIKTLNNTLLHAKKGSTIILNFSVCDDNGNPINLGRISLKDYKDSVGTLSKGDHIFNLQVNPLSSTYEFVYPFDVIKVSDLYSTTNGLVKEGFAQLSFVVNNDGENLVSTKYSDGKSISQSVIVSTDKLSLIIDSNDLKVPAGNKTIFKAKFTNLNDEPVSNLKVKFKLTDENGVSKTFSATTDNNGFAVLEKDLKPGFWSVNTIFKGNSDYDECGALNDIIVKAKSNDKNHTEDNNNTEYNNHTDDSDEILNNPISSLNHSNNHLSSNSDSISVSLRTGIELNIVVLFVILLISIPISRKFN